MQTIAFAAPVLPGQMAALRKLTDWIADERNVDAVNIRCQAGLDREQIFVQSMPEKDIAIIVWDTRDAAKVFTTFAFDESDFGSVFRRRLHEIHGIDLNNSSNFPEPTILSEWQSAVWAFDRYEPSAFCFPIAGDKKDSFRRFIATMTPGGRNFDKYTSMCRNFGIERQVFCEQPTPDGEIAVMYGEGRPDWFPNAFQAMA
ncbi:MAG: hypothetical protein H7123_05220, partial [Thermoleophilia bacterium]|nr:hypothetical protein [Thermoleophilia bacterium]